MALLFNKRFQSQEEHKQLEKFINQLGRIDIYRVLHVTTYRILTPLNAHRTFTKIGHIWGHL